MNIVPCPTNDELYPNMNYKESRWENEKYKLAERIKEITLVWNISYMQRCNFLKKGIKCWDDPSHKQITCYCPYHANHEMPFWADHSNLNKSHQANLLRKDFEYYSNHFDNTIDVSMPYLWWSKEEMDLEEEYSSKLLFFF